MPESALIESLIRRPGGTTVTLGDEDYSFEPNDKGAHICEVVDADHAERLLAITEGFAIYVPGSKPAKTPKQDRTQIVEDQGFDIQEESVDALLDADDADAERDPLELEAVTDPDKATNRALQRWADNRDINHRNKQAVLDYADRVFGVELDKRLSAINMVRELVKYENQAIEDSEV